MRLLVVEDNVKLAVSLKRGLEQEGYAVDTALDGEAGWKKLLAGLEDYNLIIMDLTLPKIDGLELCKNMRKEGIMLPVIMLTARDTVEDKIIGLDAGADDYLVKPFSFDELLARLRSCLRRPREVLPGELRVRDLTLDVTGAKVFRGGSEIKLTLKELRLLEYFMRHPGQVLLREQITGHLWDFDFDSVSNVLDAHMKNLRRKIDGGYEEKLFETVRGMGYRLKG
ncbi:MAG: response regulator transcription factor [Elusimicrobia bacterium]|nr:response regulator transcription factor [Elusimicrobiota bacterium]